MIKKYLTTWLLVLSIVISESHSYVPDKYAEKKGNWIYSIDRPMELQWNIKFLSDEINMILYGVAMFFFKRNRINETTVITFIFLCCIGLGMYFHNFKTLHYGSVYVWTLGIWFVVHIRQPIWKAVKCSLWKLKMQIVLLCQHISKMSKKK